MEWCTLVLYNGWSRVAISNDQVEYFNRIPRAACSGRYVSCLCPAAASDVDHVHVGGDISYCKDWTMSQALRDGWNGTTSCFVCLLVKHLSSFYHFPAQYVQSQASVPHSQDQ